MIKFNHVMLGKVLEVLEVLEVLGVEGRKRQAIGQGARGDPGVVG